MRKAPAGKVPQSGPAEGIPDRALGELGPRRHPQTGSRGKGMLSLLKIPSEAGPLLLGGHQEGYRPVGGRALPGYPQLVGWVRECPLGPAVVSGPCAG